MTKKHTVIDAVATEDIRSGDHVQMVVDPTTGRSTVRRAILVCAWCPEYAYPDPLHHPDGQAAHVAWASD